MFHFEYRVTVDSSYWNTITIKMKSQSSTKEHKNFETVKTSLNWTFIDTQLRGRLHNGKALFKCKLVPWSYNYWKLLSDIRYKKILIPMSVSLYQIN